MEISLVLPAYLEAENLTNILPKIKKSLSDLNVDSEVLIVDTMEAMDNTEEICKEYQVRYINRDGGNCYGDAIRTGFIKAEGKYIVVMDADGSHNPEDIKHFYRVMQSQNCDLVIGSRYCKGGYTDNNFILRFMSWSLNVTYRILFNLKVKDVSDSFRMYKADQLKDLNLECNNFDIVEEILIQLNFRIANFKAYEVPISFNKRDRGESKRDLIAFIVSYLKTIKRLLIIKNNSKKAN